MKIGDILNIEPTLEATSGLGTVGPIPARVIYIHPAGGITRWSSAVPLPATTGGRPSGLSWRRNRRTGGASHILRPQALRSEDQTKGER